MFQTNQIILRKTFDKMYNGKLKEAKSEITKLKNAIVLF